MPSVAYWVNTAIKRGTQENETKMAEQPVYFSNRETSCHTKYGEAKVAHRVPNLTISSPQNSDMR